MSTKNDQLDTLVYFTQYHLGGYGISDEDGYFYCEECGDSDRSTGPLSTLSGLKDTFLYSMNFGIKVQMNKSDQEDETTDCSPYDYEELTGIYKELIDDYDGESTVVAKSSLSKEDVILYNDSVNEDDPED